MKTLIDFFPILLFFGAFKLYDIYIGTAVLMVATVAQMGLIDVLYTFMAVKRQPEVEHSLARIGEALYRRQG